MSYLQKLLKQFSKETTPTVPLTFSSSMNPPSPPKEDKEILLPKTCYFNDGSRKVDYVLVIPKLLERVRGDNSELLINTFLKQAEKKGLAIEREPGKFHKEIIFVKIHGPHAVLVRFSNIYDMQPTCQNPYYKYKEPIWFKCWTNEVTRPNPESSCYKRAEKTLSGMRPTDFTTGERSRIVYSILSRILFTVGEVEYSMAMLISKNVFLDGYAIHDGNGFWTKEGPLTDYQLLFSFWPGLKHLYHTQPIQLIEKYYGPKVGFYFALLNLYNKMLMVPAIIGTLTVIAGLVLMKQENHYIEDEVCTSDVVLCSDQQLHSACVLTKLSYVIDNPFTIAYVILCSFWGIVFWNLWQRRQAMLKLRWNLMSIDLDRPMRFFRANAKIRRSSITGEVEYYVPAAKQIATAVFTYFVIIIMIVIYFLMVFLVVEYRFFLRKSLNYDQTYYANEIEIGTSSVVTSAIIMTINQCLPFLLKLYSKIVKFLTMLRMPRTESQYKRMYLQMTFIISFANYFSPLFYLAFIKGFFHSYPGDLSDIAFIRSLQTDLCPPAGCLVDLGMQLVTLMVVEAIFNWGFQLVKILTVPWAKRVVLELYHEEYGQWEIDYLKDDLTEDTINELYIELVLQYSFITFFNAALPIIGLISLINNLLKTQYHAYKILKLYRRPVLKKVSGIGGWNEVLRAVTVFGCISNTFVVAFRTNFIQRMVYRLQHHTMEGYVNSTLSKFAIPDIQNDLIIDHEDKKFCYYRGFRYPPDHEKKYQRTYEHWKHLAIRAIYFIILEKVTFLLAMILDYLIPTIPRKVKVKLEHDEKMLKMMREEKLEKEK